MIQTTAASAAEERNCDMGFVFDLDMDRCSACGACAVACMDQNDIDTQRCEAPFRVVRDLESPEGVCTYISLACMHCTDAPCVDACPCGCLRKDEATGFTLFDTTTCIGCHSCAMACPFGAPSFSAQGKMQKCDGCHVRVELGLEPACVRNCPTGALKLIPEEEYKAARVGRSLQRRLGL